MPDDELDWLAKIYEEHGPTLHRLVVLLGAEEQSGRIVRSALLALHRRGHRLIDPVERVEFLQEHVVHLAHAVRPPTLRLQLPEVEEPRQEEILSSISAMDPRAAEIIVVSHYLTVFGPELAGVMRMSLRRSNQRLEAALEDLRRRVGDPTPGSVPGVIESLSQEVTAALRSAARTIQAPGTGTLSGELLELGSQRGLRVGVRVVVLTCLLAVAVGLGLAAWSSAAAMTAEPSEPSTATTEPADMSSLPARVQQVPLYYVGKQDGKLYRERRELSASGDQVRVALENLFTLVVLDPDYETKWTQGQVNGVELDGRTLTIDLSANAYAPFATATEAAPAINQIVYTAADITGIPDLTVRFLADGAEPPGPFAAASGYTRDGLTPMPLMWITEPRNGIQQSAGDITIAGTVQPSAGVPTVTVLNKDTGEAVASTTAQTSTGENAEGWRTWTVLLTLEKGSYEVRVQASDPATGETQMENKLLTVID